MYAKGLGVKQDFKKGMGLIMKAAEQGNIEALAIVEKFKNLKT